MSDPRNGASSSFKRERPSGEGGWQLDLQQQQKQPTGMPTPTSATFPHLPDHNGGGGGGGGGATRSYGHSSSTYPATEPTRPPRLHHSTSTPAIEYNGRQTPSSSDHNTMSSTSMSRSSTLPSSPQPTYVPFKGLSVNVASSHLHASGWNDQLSPQMPSLSPISLNGGGGPIYGGGQPHPSMAAYGGNSDPPITPISPYSYHLPSSTYDNDPSSSTTPTTHEFPSRTFDPYASGTSYPSSQHYPHHQQQQQPRLDDEPARSRMKRTHDYTDVPPSTSASTSQPIRRPTASGSYSRPSEAYGALNPSSSTLRNYGPTFYPGVRAMIGPLTEVEAANLAATQAASKTGAGAGAFPYKTYAMLLDSTSQHLASFAPGGRSFIVHSQTEFAAEVLPRHFKHNNFSSFVRQLNMYGFHKVNKTPRGQTRNAAYQTWEFNHPSFFHGGANEIGNIKRRGPDSEALKIDPDNRKMTRSASARITRNKQTSYAGRRDVDMDSDSDSDVDEDDEEEDDDDEEDDKPYRSSSSGTSPGQESTVRKISQPPQRVASASSSAGNTVVPTSSPSSLNSPASMVPLPTERHSSLSHLADASSTAIDAFSLPLPPLPHLPSAAKPAKPSLQQMNPRPRVNPAQAPSRSHPSAAAAPQPVPTSATAVGPPSSHAPSHQHAHHPFPPTSRSSLPPLPNYDMVPLPDRVQLLERERRELHASLVEGRQTSQTLWSELEDSRRQQAALVSLLHEVYEVVQRSQPTALPYQWPAHVFQPRVMDVSPAISITADDPRRFFSAPAPPLPPPPQSLAVFNSYIPPSATDVYSHRPDPVYRSTSQSDLTFVPPSASSTVAGFSSSNRYQTHSTSTSASASPNLFVDTTLSNAPVSPHHHRGLSPHSQNGSTTLAPTPSPTAGHFDRAVHTKLPVSPLDLGDGVTYYSGNGGGREAQDEDENMMHGDEEESVEEVGDDSDDDYDPRGKKSGRVM